MIRELNTSLVSNDVDLAFPLVTFASSFRDESTMNPRAAADRRNRKRSNGIRLCFRAAWKKKKKSMRSRYRCVLTGRRFTLIPQTGRNQYGNTTRSNRKRSLLRNTPERVDHPSPSPLLVISSLFLFRKEILLPFFGFSPFPINKFWYFFFFSRSFNRVGFNFVL